jgi:endoglucanase Acf2
MKEIHNPSSSRGNEAPTQFRVPPSAFRLSTVAVFAGLAILIPAIHAEVVQAGAGSFLTTAPKPCKPLPDTIYKTADVKGAMITGQWWSSLIWQPYSQAMFAHPLAMRCSENGLAVWYPGANITANKSAIFGGGSGKDGDLKIGHSSVAAFPQADCGGYSDWFVTAVFASGEASLRVSFGHGSPFVFCRITGGQPRVMFAKAPQVWSGASQDAVLGITANGHHYGLFGASGSTWSGLDGTNFVNDAKGKDYFAVALLPDNKPETLALFRKCAYNHVTDTRLEFTVEGGAVKANYRFTFAPREGADVGTLFALYPHQWKYATSPLTELAYGSVRGAMKVGAGASFSTAVPVQGVLPMLPAQGIADRERMLGYLKAEATRDAQRHCRSRECARTAKGIQFGNQTPP